MKLGIFLTLTVLLSCTSANLHPKNAKSDKKSALVDRFLEKKAGIENPADSLKPKDWVKYVEQKVATNLKADEEKTEKKQHENARSNPVLSKLLRPSGSDVTAVKPADLERVSSQHFRQPEQQVEGYIARYGRSSHVDNVMKMQEVMRHVSEISREDPRGDAADMVPDFLRGHNAVQSGSRHDAHEGHAPMVDPEEEKGHEHPNPGVLTGKHSESLHHGLKQTLQGLEHAKAEEASRKSGHEVHAHQKHQESIHGRNPYPVGEELDKAKKQAEESGAKADPTPEAANQEKGKEDAGAAEARSIVEKIRLMQEMAKKQAEESEVTGQGEPSSTSDEGDAENAVPAPSEEAEEKETNAVLAQEENTEDAGAAAANSIVEKIQMMRKMAALAKASSSENADPPSDAQADLDDAGAAEASSIVEKIQMMQRMAALAKMMKKMREGSEEEKGEALEEAKEVLPPEVLSAIKSKLDQEPGDMDKDAVETAERPSPSPLVREKLRQSGRLHPVNKEDKASNEERQTEGLGARVENPGQPEGKAPERPSMQESPAGTERPAEHPTLSSLRKESLRESGRLVTGDKTTSDDGNPTEEDFEDHKTDARQSKEAGKEGPTMEESPKIILHSGEKEQTTETNEETAANSDGPAKALGAIMKAMAIAKAQQHTSASTGVKDQVASEDSKPALTPESIEKKLQVIQAIKHATELANGRGKQPASIEADDTSKNNEEKNLEIDNDQSAPKAVTQEEPTSIDGDEAARALEEAIKKAVAIAKEGRQETQASAEAKTPEPTTESKQTPLTPENKEKELQVMEAIRHAMEFAKRREESSASIEAEVQVAKALDTAEPTVNAENKEEEDQEIGNNDEASKTAPSQDDKLDSDRNAFNALQQVNKLRKLKHMASDEASKNGVEDSQKENNIVDDIGSVDQIANNKPQDDALKGQSKEEKAKRVLDTMAELQAAASNQKKQLNSEEAIAKTEEEKSEDNNLGSRSQAAQAIMETIGKIRQEAEERAHVQEKDDPTPETTQESKGKVIDEADQKTAVNTESSGPDTSPEAAVREEDKGDVETDEASSILEKIQLMQKMAALAKVVKKMKDGSEEEKEEALEEAKEMLPPEILSVVQAKIAEESGNQEKGKDDMEEETAGESLEAKVEEEIEENQDTQEAEEDTEEERTGEETGGNIEEDEENVQFKKDGSVEGLNLAVAEPEEHLGGTGKDDKTVKESGEENLSNGPEESLLENKKEEQNEENHSEESRILGDVDKTQALINPQDQDERKFKDSLIEDEDDLSLETSQESAQRAEEHIKTGHDTEEGTNDNQNDQEDEDVGETKERDSLTRLANIKATLAHLQRLEEEQQDQKSDVTGKEEEDHIAPAEELLPQKPADSTPTKNGKIETRTTQFQETELDEKKNEGEVNVRASQKPADDSMTTKNAKTEARITHDQLQGPENDDEKENELEGEGNEVEHVRVSLSQKAAAAEKVQRKALIAAGIAQSHLKAHGIKAPKSQEQPDEHKHLKGDATSVKKTSYYLSEEGKLRSSDEAHKEAKKQKIFKVKNNLLSDGVAKTSQETLEDMTSGSDKIRSPEELFSKEKETERSAENKGLKPASPFLQGAFMAALQGKPDKEHPQSSDRTSKIPPYYLSKEKVMKSSDEFLEEEVLSVGKEEMSPVRPLPKDLARKNKISDKDTKGQISKEVLLTMEDKKKVRSDEKKLTGLLSNAVDVKKENKTKLDKETKTKTGLKMSAKPKSLFGKAVKAGKHRNLAKLREMAMAMAKKRRLPRGRRT